MNLIFIELVTVISMLPKDLYKTLIDKNENHLTNDDYLWTDFISIIETPLQSELVYLMKQHYKELNANILAGMLYLPAV